MLNMVIIILSVLVLTAFIIIISMIVSFGKIVGAGGDLTNSIVDLIKTDKYESDNSIVTKKPLHQTTRTIAGLLFGALMLLYPVLYGERTNGSQYYNIDPQVRFYLLGFLVATELILFIVMWIQDRNSKQ